MMSEKKLQVLLEMRPALDGYAGIPQETRLLFRGLCMINSVELEGLLQTSLRFLSSGTKKEVTSAATLSESARLDRYSRIVISLDSKPSTHPFAMFMLYLKRRRAGYALTLSSILLPGWHKVTTSLFQSRHFETFIWQSLFAKTLPATDFALVTAKNYKICTVPWNIFQSAGLNALKFFAKPVYPILDTGNADIFITQTPYPARLNGKTALVVRYHDALPIFMPHAFANKGRHQATHFHALASNVRSGAFFACVSEATRQDLLRIFPEVKERTVTIHNMVSPHFFEEASSSNRVPQIIRSRLNLLAPEAHPQFKSLLEQESFYKQHFEQLPLKYLLMVSTIEPRKNHSQLITAWEMIRAETDPSIKLVIVGSLGWDVEPIMREMRTWIDQGMLFVLSNVPAGDLRVLYRHASATICPSLAEGFNFSGVEAMSSGGITIASNIAVHREVFAEAAEYFDPYSALSLAHTIKKILYEPASAQAQLEMRQLGKKVAARYLPDVILPQWEKFLQHVANGSKVLNAPIRVPDMPVAVAAA